MEIEYEVTADDLYAFHWRSVFRSPRGRRDRRRAYLYWFLVVFLMTILPAIGSDGFVIARVNFTFLVVAYPVVVLMQWLLYRRLTRRGILRLLKDVLPNKGLLGRHKVVLNEGELIESTAVGESRTLWAGVDRVEQNAEYIFIYTQPHAAHIIPKRAFNSSQAAESFYQLARISKEGAA
jgi:hypothetical protein